MYKLPGREVQVEHREAGQQRLGPRLLVRQGRQPRGDGHQGLGEEKCQVERKYEAAQMINLDKMLLWRQSPSSTNTSIADGGS